MSQKTHNLLDQAKDLALRLVSTLSVSEADFDRDKTVKIFEEACGFVDQRQDFFISIQPPAPGALDLSEVVSVDRIFVGVCHLVVKAATVLIEQDALLEAQTFEEFENKTKNAEHVLRTLQSSLPSKVIDDHQSAAQVFTHGTALVFAALLPGLPASNMFNLTANQQEFLARWHVNSLEAFSSVLLPKRPVVISLERAVAHVQQNPKPFCQHHLDALIPLWLAEAPFDRQLFAVLDKLSLGSCFLPQTKKHIEKIVFTQDKLISNIENNSPDLAESIAKNLPSDAIIQALQQIKSTPQNLSQMPTVKAFWEREILEKHVRSNQTAPVKRSPKSKL